MEQEIIDVEAVITGVETEGKIEPVELKVEKVTPSTIAWNFEEVKKYLSKTLEKYSKKENLIVNSEDDLKRVSQMKAKLVSDAKKYDELRKKVKKQLTSQANVVDDQFKELIELHEDVASPFKKILDEEEEKRKTAKKNEMMEIVKQRFIDNEIDEKLQKEFVFNDRLLNKTISQVDMDTIIDSEINRLVAIKEKGLENIRTITEMVKSKNEEYELSVPIEHKKYTDLLVSGSALSSVMMMIDADFKSAKALMFKAKEEAIQEVAQKPIKVVAQGKMNDVIESIAPELKVATDSPKVVWRAEFIASKEQINFLCNVAKESGIEFKTIKENGGNK